MLELQSEFNNFFCFPCLWDSRADSEHFVKIEWPCSGLELALHVPVFFEVSRSLHADRTFICVPNLISLVSALLK